jgi:choline-glycine betaine transporter
MPATLMFIGAIRVLQNTLLIVSPPILIIGVVMSVSIVKMLNEDFPRDAPTKS